jgi:hypothetical protein
MDGIKWEKCSAAGMGMAGSGMAWAAIVDYSFQCCRYFKILSIVFKSELFENCCLNDLTVFCSLMSKFKNN